MNGAKPTPRKAPRRFEGKDAVELARQSRPQPSIGVPGQRRRRFSEKFARYNNMQRLRFGLFVLALALGILGVSVLFASLSSVELPSFGPKR